jgi:hypothetical protein|tara:strand:+ start:358 stop:480 length:123 start_codon:yes stop_codon:yes gene_type:complete
MEFLQGLTYFTVGIICLPILLLTLIAEYLWTIIKKIKQYV